MASISLPDRANLTQLRKQARELQRAVRAGSPAARDLVADHHPAGAPDADTAATFSLSAARLVISRRYGFPSWTRLKRHVELIQQYTRVPPDAPVAGEADAVAGGAGAVSGAAAGGGPGELGDEFLRLGCLWYEDDQPERWARARSLLAAHPELTRGHVHAAAAAADVATLRAILGADPGAARREGGPYRAEPLYYLAYARHDPQLSQDAVLTSARLLLAAGADPNAGYFWRGLPTPFTVLTGVLGHGELGPDRQPPHPHAPALARLLLESGADPNDAQALYNRMFEPGQEHLELLLEFGLGTGDGGPWRARLGDALGSPAELVRGQLEWAVTHGLADRVRLLGRHGVDVTSRAPGRQSPAELAPIELALTTGHAELVEVLSEFGAAPAELDPDEAMVARLLAGDQAGAERLDRDNPLALEEVKLTRPGLIVWAAVLGRTSAVDLIADLGFDVNAKARTDG
ncbi:MAG TPA: hypothetical protein VH089_10730, partial [Streptosporangiaceae bacterium]|nr:hypothetical protein [Streptosporangiaceae bacterium]